MIKFLSNIPIFRRLFIAFAIAAAIPAVIIVLLGNFYLTSLNQRSQAVSTSFDSQRIASQQQTNLQTMHTLLEASQLANWARRSRFNDEGGMRYFRLNARLKAAAEA